MARKDRSSQALLAESQAAWDCFGEWLATLGGPPYMRLLFLEICERDLYAAHVLEQLAFWVRPSKKTGKRKTALASTVVKRDIEFAEQLNIKPRSLRTARANLQKAGFIRCVSAKSPLYHGGKALHYEILAGPILATAAKVNSDWRDYWERAKAGSGDRGNGEAEPMVDARPPSIPIATESTARQARFVARPPLSQLEKEIGGEALTDWEAYKDMIAAGSKNGQADEAVLVNRLMAILAGKSREELTWDQIAHGLFKAACANVDHPNYVLRAALGYDRY